MEIIIFVLIIIFIAYLFDFYKKMYLLKEDTDKINRMLEEIYLLIKNNDNKKG